MKNVKEIIAGGKNIGAEKVSHTFYMVKARDKYEALKRIADIKARQGSFVDERDGQSYTSIRIGTQVWMAQNLNYNAAGSWCYADDTDNCLKYGRLYTWAGAMESCPSGWHLPSDSEWETLTEFLGSKTGRKLKSRSSWDKVGIPTAINGSNTSGFNGFPAGYSAQGKTLGMVGCDASFWSSTEEEPITFKRMGFNSRAAYLKAVESAKTLDNRAKTRKLSFVSDDLNGYFSAYKDKGLSCRCLKD